MSTKSRTRSKLYTVINNAQSWNSAGVPGTPSTVKLFQTLNCNKSRTGVPNLKWRSQIIRGENASTDFSGTENTATFVGQTYDVQFKQPAPSLAKSHLWGQTLPLQADMPTAPSFMSQTKADNMARQRFYKNAIKAQRYLQSGVFLGELRQTLGLIRNPAKSARLLIDVFATSARKLAKPRRGLKGKLTTKQKTLLVKNAIADSWLEFSFGWSPLVSDIDAGAKLLADLAVKAKHEFANIEGSWRDSDNPTITSSLTGLATNRFFSVLETKRTSRECMVKYYGRIRLDVPELADGRIMSGLGLTSADIIPTAWELVPWSFFVDYFTNVGDVLEAWSYPVSKLAWASKVVVEYRKAACFWSYNEPRTKALIGSGFTSAKVKGNAVRASGEKRVTRTAVVFVRPPELQFELPFSSRKFFNIGALLATSRRGIR